MPEWRVYYGDGSTVSGGSCAEWQAAPIVGVQVLMKRLDVAADGRSRVGWYADDEYRRLYHDFHFYLWQEDGPAGVTPDAVLDAWASKTGDTSVRIADLSLDDLHSIGVKCGRSLPNDKFQQILSKATNDPAFP